MMTPEIDQLLQFCRGPVWDGNVIGKTQRDRLIEHGLVERVNGWSFLTKEGVMLCVTLQLLNENVPQSDGSLLRAATKPPGFA